MAYVFNVIASVGRQNDVNAAITLKNMPGAIARSVAMSLKRIKMHRDRSSRPAHLFVKI